MDLSYMPMPPGWVNPLRVSDMERQESKDYRESLEVFDELLSGRMWELTPAPMLCVFDGVLTVGGKKFLVEWKDRRQSEKFDNYPILLSKYDNLMRAQRRERADGVLYLMLNSGKYTLYRLDKVNINACPIRDWYIKKYELSDDTHREPQTAIFLPKSLAVCTGNYTPL